MAYQVLARKYRPQRFSDVIGQEHVTRTLKNAIERGRIAHGYIFSGHRGIGKTTVARILAMALNCRSADHPVAEPCGVCESCTEIRAGNAVDVIEIDAATNRGIDEIRELREAARYRPARDRFKIWILDEAHQITDAAFNALLKTLEEPPSHVIFMLATTQPEDIPQTIRSRCQHFSFHAVRFDEIVKQLRDIASLERVSADDNALAMLAEAGDGSMRDALSIMDQAIACCGERLTADMVRQLVGAVPSEILERLMNAVAGNSAEDVLQQVDRLLTEGHNPAHFARQMARFLRNAMVAKVAGTESPLLQISADERARVGRVAEQFSEEDLARFLQIMLRTHSELGYKQEQRFHLELGLLKLVHAQRLLPLEQILSEAQPTPTVVRASDPRTRIGDAGRAGTSRAGSGSAGTSQPSPFEIDRARKSAASPEWDPPRTPKSQTSGAPDGTSTVRGGGHAVEYQAATAEPAVAVESAPESLEEVSAEVVRKAVLSALENADFRALGSSILEPGTYTLEGATLVFKVSVTQTVADMSMNAEAQRVANQAASSAAGRPIKVKVVGGAATNGGTRPAPRPTNGPGARRRAADDPVVRRMQEKFSAQIRTVIDHRERK
ncbi:MAG: DNA polymerase III subunit gamma/tau [Acidobacteriia bacterium]|nr:DNA polymerase III subunit gamma/tau [Terriglobia bacterium]